MRIKEIRIQNFRRLVDVTIPLTPYTCFVGQNGAGKSTVLAALNIFFKEQSGSSTDVSKLAPYVQWVYVPAVKDATDESQEAKTSALGKLLARTVRSRINFDAEIEQLKAETLTRYLELLNRNQDSLNEISASLQRRLSEWANPGTRLSLEWMPTPTHGAQ